MANTEIVEYIRQQSAAGYSEAVLREHLLKQGWSSTNIDDALIEYKQAPKPVTPARAGTTEPRRGSRPRRQRSGLRRFGRSMAALAALAILGLVLFRIFGNHKPAPVDFVTPTLTHQQQQTLDINTLGGAVGQYVVLNDKTLPDRVVAAPDGSSVVLCGKTCEPNTWQVSALKIYKPEGVKLIPYAAKLAVPDSGTLYIVSGATCNNGALTNQGVRVLSMAILYGVEANSKLQQRCITL